MVLEEQVDFKGKKIDPRISAAKAEAITEAYHRVRKTQMPCIDGPGIEKQTMWTPPPEAVFKLNMDAAISSTYQKA